MAPLRKSELRKISPKIDPKKSLRIIRKLRASTYGPANKCCWLSMGGVANAYASNIYCTMICDRHKNKTKLQRSNLVHIVKIGCEITAAK